MGGLKLVQWNCESFGMHIGLLYFSCYCDRLWLIAYRIYEDIVNKVYNEYNIKINDQYEKPIKIQIKRGKSSEE